MNNKRKNLSIRDRKIRLASVKKYIDSCIEQVDFSGRYVSIKDISANVHYMVNSQAFRKHIRRETCASDNHQKRTYINVLAHEKLKKLIRELSGEENVCLNNLTDCQLVKIEKTIEVKQNLKQLLRNLSGEDDTILFDISTEQLVKLEQIFETLKK